MLKNQNTQSGFSLIQVLVSMLVGLFILAGMISMYVSTVTASNDMLRMERFNYQMQQALDFMVRDIRRAGYWGNAVSMLDTGLNINPFMSAGTDISYSAGNNCILFAYDIDKSGALPGEGTLPDDKRYGFRLMGQAVQARVTTGAFSCSAAAGDWEVLTNPSEVTITDLTFTPVYNIVDVDGTGAGTATMTIREVLISISGTSATDATVNKTLTESVKVRNDLFTA